MTQQVLLRRPEQALDLSILCFDLVRQVRVEGFVTMTLVLANHEEIIVIFTHKDALSAEYPPSTSLLCIVTDLLEGEWQRELRQICHHATIKQVIPRVDSLRSVRAPFKDVVVSGWSWSLLTSSSCVASDLLRGKLLLADSVIRVHIILFELVNLHLHLLLISLSLTQESIQLFNHLVFFVELVRQLLDVRLLLSDLLVSLSH